MEKRENNEWSLISLAIRRGLPFCCPCSQWSAADGRLFGLASLLILQIQISIPQLQQYKAKAE
jgi:hypothetical protein